MSDALCRVCGEPWDTYHIRHDAPAWVAPLFFAGAGCESCEGQAPEGADSGALALASDTNLVIGGVTDEDPLSLRGAIAGGAPPKWRRPVNPTVWECECGVAVVRDVDNREGHEAAFYVETPPGMSYYQERNLGIARGNEFSSLSDATDEISHDGMRCKLCAYPCGDCSRIIADEGESYPDLREYYGSRLCEDCYCEAAYEAALESYSLADLLTALAYSSQDHVWQWFDNRETSEVSERLRDTAIDLGVCEVEGPSMIYKAPQRYYRTPAEQRTATARVLWALREAVRE